MNDWVVFRMLYNALFRKTMWMGPSFDNLSFAENFLMRAAQFFSIFGYERHFGPLSPVNIGPPRIVSIYAGLFIFCFFILLSKGLRKIHIREGKNILFILSVFTIIFTGLCFTVTMLRTLHMFFLAPVAQIIVAGGLYYFSRSLIKLAHLPNKGKFWIISAFSAMIILPRTAIIREISANYPTYYDYASPALYALSEYIETTSSSNHLVVLNSFEYLGMPLYVLSKGSLRIYSPNPEKSEYVWLKNLMRELEDQTDFSLVIYQDFSLYFNQIEPLFETFMEKVSGLGHTKKLEKEFYDISGRIIYRYYEFALPHKA